MESKPSHDKRVRNDTRNNSASAPDRSWQSRCELVDCGFRQETTGGGLNFYWLEIKNRSSVDCLFELSPPLVPKERITYHNLNTRRQVWWSKLRIFHLTKIDNADA